ncbi:MAG: hypothetical protein KKC85_04020 [Gammaproteobacteria bacterium]|nr:hypothetical protein [Gammaproteobacteria bacterium]MBU2285583.1 hypothetical protein [Gammaproteobacteria bacterium]
MKHSIAICTLAALCATWTSTAGAAGLGERVAAMSEKGRRAFMAVLVNQSGFKCPTVQRAFHQGESDGTAGTSTFWNASCGPRADYAIVFHNDKGNSTRVVKCDQAQFHGASAPCFKKFAADSRPTAERAGGSAVASLSRP